MPNAAEANAKEHGHADLHGFLLFAGGEEIAIGEESMDVTINRVSLVKPEGVQEGSRALLWCLNESVE
jgi:hypothetical protein